MALLLIFILSYGIASQALRHPTPIRAYKNITLATVAKEVILNPYWQMYGELLLDELKGKN